MSARQSTPTTRRLGSERCSVRSARAIAGGLAEGRHQQRAVDEVEVDVGGRQPLPSYATGRGIGSLDDLERPALPASRARSSGRRLSRSTR